MLIGSEGTLGIITEIRLRLFPIPEQISAAVCAYPNVEVAAQVVIECMQMGIPLARVELLDKAQMGACINYSNLQDFEVAPTLFFEFHGTESGVQEQIELVQDISKANNGGEFRWAQTQEQRNELWAARHNAYFAGRAMRPGWDVLTTDVCVPISCLADAIGESERRAKELNLLTAIVGHVGDGNFHILVLFDGADSAAEKLAYDYASSIVQMAIAMGGTCTGEHGIGLRKKKYLATELGDEAVNAMVTIKRAMDPLNILNPGKIFDVV